MVSAKSHEDNIVQGLNAGGNDYLAKPFRRQEILARIETQLKLKEMWRMEVKAARSNQLLQEMLPRSIIERLEGGQRMIADAHSKVTILFSDIVGFTTIAAMLSTAEVRPSSFLCLCSSVCLRRISRCASLLLVAYSLGYSCR
jgi:response regulator RpfG family c-di-GMP phosphodiesterase